MVNAREFSSIQEFFFATASSRLLALHFSIMPNFYFSNNILTFWNAAPLNNFKMFDTFITKLLPKSVEQLAFLKRCLSESTLYELHLLALQYLLSNFSFTVLFYENGNKISRF